MNLKSLVTGVAVCAVTAGLLLYSLEYRNLDAGPGDPGAMFIPRLMLVVTFGLAAWLAVAAFRSAPQPARPASPDPAEDEDMPTGITLNFVIAMGLTLAYLVCFYFRGYFWATPIYLGCILWLARIRYWRSIIIVAGGFTAFAYLVFFRLLDVPLLTP